MSKRTPIKNDEELGRVRKHGKHKRSEIIDNAFVGLIILIGIAAAIAIIYSIYLYTAAFQNPDILPDNSKKTMEDMFTHGIAVLLGSYLASIAKRNIED